MNLFIEDGVTGTVCVNKTGETDQTVTVMISGRKQFSAAEEYNSIHTLLSLALQAETGDNIDQQLALAPEDSQMCITFNILDDNIAIEETETFTWRLEIVTVIPGVRVGDFNTTVIGIMDDDSTIIY